MLEKRHVIRKTQPDRALRIDDQLWPLVVALAILGGFLAGTILAYLPVDDPRWYRNALTWLIVIPLVIAAALIWLALTGNRLLRRTMQLAMVGCAIIHVILFILAVETDVFRRVWMEVVASAEQSVDKQRAKIPEFTPVQRDRREQMRRELTEPVEAPAPDPKPTPLEQPPDSPRPPEVERLEPPVPDPEQAVRPNVAKRQEPSRTEPKPSETQSKLSRSQPKFPSQSEPSVSVPALPNQREQRPEALPRHVAGTQARQPDRSATRPPSRQDPQMTQEIQTPRLAQRSKNRVPEPTASAAATLRRRQAEPTVVPRTDVAASSAPSVARQTTDDAPQPNRTAMPKQRVTASPERVEADPAARQVASDLATRSRPRQLDVTRQPDQLQTPLPVEHHRRAPTHRVPTQTVVDRASATERPVAEEREVRPSSAAQLTRDDAQPSQPTPDRAMERPDQQTAPAVVERASSRRNDEENQPRVASRAPQRPAPRKARPLGVKPQRISPVAAEASRKSLAESAAGATASPVRVERQSIGESKAGAAARVAVETPGSAPVMQVANTPRKSTQNEPAPSLAPDASRDNRAMRSSIAARQPTSITQIEQLVAPSAPRLPASSQPAATRMALSKATVGTAGSGASRNLGRADRSPAGLASVASSAAQRARATQDSPAGPSLSPQSPALVRQSRAGRMQPSATVTATRKVAARLKASSETGDLSASSSAALQRASSNADSGSVTAAKGASEVDTGPTTLVAEGVAARAGGGGQPALSTGITSPVLPRSASRSDRPPALATTETASPASPLEQGGRPTESTQSASPATSLVRAAPQTPAPTLGGPSMMAGTGVPEASGLAASTLTRQLAGDGPEVGQAVQPGRLPAKNSGADRQLPFDSGPIDLAVGDAEGRDEGQVPVTELAGRLDQMRIDRSPNGDAKPNGARPDPAADSNAVAALSGPTAARRANPTDAGPGPVNEGGGQDMPRRTSTGPPLVTNTRANINQMAGNPESSGERRNEPLADSGGSIQRLTGGPALPATVEPAGAAAGAMLVKSGTGKVIGTTAVARNESTAEQSGPMVRDDRQKGGPGKRRTQLVLPSTGRVAAVENVTPGSRLPSDSQPSEGLAAAPTSGLMQKSSGAALPVDVKAPIGPGGIGLQVAMDAGVATRRARRENLEVRLETTRFIRKNLGGLPQLSSAVAVPTDSFQSRMLRTGRGLSGPTGGPGPQTEQAIELGLAFLRRAQTPSGKWTLDQFASQDGLPQMASDTAATGLALLAFQGAGYHHLDYQYADQVRRGLDFLVQNQQDNGDLFVSMDGESNRVVRFYSHGIAALALCEAYGMTQDPQLKEPAQKALNFIVDTQNPDRGGWRYTPRIGSDTSVSGWMMMALKSGQLANLETPPDTYQRITQWLDQAQVSSAKRHLYCYNPYAADTPAQRAGRVPTKTMTSVGLLMRLYSGWRRDNSNMQRGAQYLADNGPAIGTTARPERDTYYWYYATQVMFHMGGKYWDAWNRKLHPILVDAQIEQGELAGSWDPSRPIPDRWAPFAGRIYVTTMNLLSLEVHYRNLPIYDETAK